MGSVRFIFLDEETANDELGVKAIPGYSGFVPGVAPEGKYGASKHKLNVESFIDRYRRPSTSVDAKPERRSNYRAGLDVVGYTGFVPGKHAGNIYAKTFSNANFASQKLSQKLRPVNPEAHNAFVEKALRKFESVAPSNEYGNFFIYRASQNKSDSPR